MAAGTARRLEGLRELARRVRRAFQPFGIEHVEPRLRTAGSMTAEIAGSPLRLDLGFPHERRLAARHLLDLRYPGADIDTLLWRRFVRPGDVVLDAGANIGRTALEALEAGASQVHCIEPVPDLAARLEAIGERRIVVHRFALGERPGSVELTLSHTHNQGATYKSEIVDLFGEVFGEHHKRVSVPLKSLDDLDLPAFDIWKIDVEGAEVDLVRGAGRTLSTRPPRAIFVEVYAPMLEDFLALVRPSHPHIYRASIDRRDYSLRLSPSLGPPRGAYHTSPMYVCLETPIQAA